MSDYKEIGRRIFCADGASLSVQASAFHYSTPRDNFGPYTHVEVGYPSAKPPKAWAEYMDGDAFNKHWASSVYGQVPVEVVAAYIKRHGGVSVNWLVYGAAE